MDLSSAAPDSSSRVWGLAGLIFGSHQIDATVWILPPIVDLFLILLVMHDRCIRQAKPIRTNPGFLRTWARADSTIHGQGKANPGEAHNPPGHPYANDLDIFGEGSIFELLCTARTQAGQGSAWPAGCSNPVPVHHTSRAPGSHPRTHASSFSTSKNSGYSDPRCPAQRPPKLTLKPGPLPHCRFNSQSALTGSGRR